MSLGCLQHLGTEGASHPAFPAVFRNLQRTQSTHVSSEYWSWQPFKCLSTALWAVPDSLGTPGSCLLPQAHQDPDCLPPLTHRSHSAHPEASNCTSLPSWKLHTPLCRSGPHAPACLYLWVAGRGDKRCLECGLSSAGRREGGGTTGRLVGPVQSQLNSVGYQVSSRSGPSAGLIHSYSLVLEWNCIW